MALTRAGMPAAWGDTEQALDRAATSPQRALSSCTAVVTGGSSGIGRAIAVAFAEQGAHVLLPGRRAGALEEVADAATRVGGRATLYHADLTRERDVTALCERVSEATQGSLAFLVHSAAQYRKGSLEELSCEQFDELFATNLRAPFLLTRGLLPALRRARGDIVFVNSLGAFNPGPTIPAYAASKAALHALADSLRAHINPDGVRVLSVFPGSSATAMQEELCRQEGRAFHPEVLLQPRDIAASVLHALLLPRTAELTELRIRPTQKWR
jgi:NAD(P)-dependent dehydrogenase (short-subunit alcohol dehydrogenase family)